MLPGNSRRYQFLSPRGEGLVRSEEEDPNVPRVLYGEVDLGNPFHEEFAVLVTLLAIPLQHLGSLEQVILFTDLKGLRTAAGGGGARGRHGLRDFPYNRGRVNHFVGVVKGLQT
jgi:hypothetical protein